MNWEEICNRARSDLVITTAGNKCLLLWDHSSRVTEYARKIVDFPEVRRRSPDMTAIVVAALYHEAGWIHRLRNSADGHHDILLKPLDEAERRMGARIMQASLKKLVTPESLAKAVLAIQELSRREIETIEGQVVAEADNLDEFGVMSLWTSIRRCTLDGKGVGAVIATWRRRKEYHFWEARLRDSFRFSGVRAVALRRLEQFDRMMLELEEQHEGVDLVSDIVYNSVEAQV